MGVSYAAQRVVVHDRSLCWLQNSGKPELYMGRAEVEVDPPTCSSPTNSACLPQLSISSTIFYEIETLWVTWLLIVQDASFTKCSSMSSRWGENSNIQAG